MTCEECQDRLLDLVYDELDGGARAEVESHLALCEGCREAHEGMTSTRRAMAMLPEEVPTRGDDFVLQAAAREARLRTSGAGPAARLGRFLVRHPVVAAGATAGLVVFMVVRVAGVDLKTASDKALPAAQAPAAPPADDLRDRARREATAAEEAEGGTAAPAKPASKETPVGTAAPAEPASGETPVGTAAPARLAAGEPLGTKGGTETLGGLVRKAPTHAAPEQKAGRAGAVMDLDREVADARDAARRARRALRHEAPPQRGDVEPPPAAKEAKAMAKKEAPSAPRAPAPVGLAEAFAPGEASAASSREEAADGEAPLGGAATGDEAERGARVPVGTASGAAAVEADRTERPVVTGNAAAAERMAEAEPPPAPAPPRPRAAPTSAAPPSAAPATAASRDQAEDEVAAEHAKAKTPAREEGEGPLRAAAGLARTGRCAEALPRLAALLPELSEADRAEAHYWRCVCLGRAGRTDEARDACALAVAGGAGTEWPERARELLRSLRAAPEAPPAGQKSP